MENCQNCRECLRLFDMKEQGSGLPLDVVRMIVCPTCGNKRCPKATNHELSCTGSNETGQPGSVYQ